METTHRKFPVHLGDLTGPAGNAYMILGAVKSAHKQCEQAGVENLPDIAKVMEEMRAGTYEMLLDTVLKYCDDLDGSIEHLQETDNEEDW